MKPTPILLAFCLLGACGCRQPSAPAAAREQARATQAGQGSTMGLSLASTAFADGQAIPAQHTGDGADQSPPLAWTGVPPGAVELALICEDRDAPTGDFVHWLVYNLPPTTTALKPGVKPTEPGFTQGRNDFSQAGYRGPAPPPGKVHHYRFRLLALDTRSGLGANADKRQLRAAAKGHIIAETELVGTYQR